MSRKRFIVLKAYEHGGPGTYLCGPGFSKETHWDVSEGWRVVSVTPDQRGYWLILLDEIQPSDTGPYRGPS